MSAFLGPIHVQMYNKILYLQHLAKCLDPSLERQFPDVDLADIIDHNNIHGWLDAACKQASQLFIQAYNKNPDSNILKVEGAKLDKPNTAGEAFRTIVSYSLDGMPCDKGLAIQYSDDAQILFSYNLDVVNPTLIQARLAWMEGLLERTNISVNRLSDSQFEVKEKSC